MVLQLLAVAAQLYQPMTVVPIVLMAVWESQPSQDPQAIGGLEAVVVMVVAT